MNEFCSIVCRTKPRNTSLRNPVRHVQNLWLVNVDIKRTNVIAHTNYHSKIWPSKNRSAVGFFSTLLGIEYPAMTGWFLIFLPSFIELFDQILSDRLTNKCDEFCRLIMFMNIKNQSHLPQIQLDHLCNWKAKIVFYTLGPQLTYVSEPRLIFKVNASSTKVFPCQQN